MKQRKYPTPQQVGRAGELFVAADLNRRGALATLYLTNTPRVDVVAMRPDTSRTVNLQVKTKGPRSKGWQWDINTARAERQAPESDFLVLVDLQPAAPVVGLLLGGGCLVAPEPHRSGHARPGGGDFVFGLAGPDPAGYAPRLPSCEGLGSPLFECTPRGRPGPSTRPPRPL